MTKFQKRIRLKEFNYTGYYRYSVTICTDRKQELFVGDNIAKNCIDILQRISEKYDFNVWVYCFMPNHLHLLIEGRNESSNFRKFISAFKQITSFQFTKVVRSFNFANQKATINGQQSTINRIRQANLKVRTTVRTTTKLWQENYFERILRKEEDTIEVAKYILNNPVRKDLVENYLDYPYLGSFIMDIKNLK